MPTEQPRPSERNIVINGVRLSDPEIAEVESTFRTKLIDGAFWYDRACGACGHRGWAGARYHPSGYRSWRRSG